MVVDLFSNDTGKTANVNHRHNNNVVRINNNKTSNIKEEKT